MSGSLSQECGERVCAVAVAAQQLRVHVCCPNLQNALHQLVGVSLFAVSLISFAHEALNSLTCDHKQCCDLRPTTSELRNDCA